VKRWFESARAFQARYTAIVPAGHAPVARSGRKMPNALVVSSSHTPEKRCRTDWHSAAEAE